MPSTASKPQMVNVRASGSAVSGDEQLWKYFRLDRFLTTIATGQIYFAAANQFADPFEGAIAVQLPGNPPVPTDSGVQHAFRELKRLTKISCWHRASYESDAMWNLYAGQHKGIAICTTPDRIRQAFKPFRLSPSYEPEDMWVGAVAYMDLTQGRTPSGMLDRFFYKHSAFAWEREYRLAISLRIAEEFGVQVPADGIPVDVDLEQLIDRIVLGSTTTSDERAVVTDHVHRVGLASRLELSTLLGSPQYF